jgi:O-antigen ligase
MWISSPGPALLSQLKDPPGVAMRGAARAKSQLKLPTDGELSVIPRDALSLTIFLLIIVSISRIHQHYAAVASLRPALSLIAISGLLIALNPSRLSSAAFRTWPARVVAALVVLALISVPFGLSMGNSAKFLLDVYFRVLFVYLIVASIWNTPRTISYLVWAFVIAVSILCWQAIVVFELGAGMGDQLRLNDLYTYDSNDLGVLLLMGIPLSVTVFEASKSWGKLFGLLVLLATGVAIARTGSRGTFVGLIGLAASFIVWARHIPLSRRVVSVVVVVAALAAAAPQGYWEQMRSLQNPTEDYNWDSESGRRQLAQRGVEYMFRYPLTGLGVNNFTKAEWQISSMAEQVGRRKGIRGKAAHNTWIQIGSELGVTGLVLWLLLVFGTMWAVARTRKQLPVAWKRGPPAQRLLYSLSFTLPLAIWAFAVPSTFVSHAYMDPMYFLAALSAGYLVAVRRESGLVWKTTVERTSQVA